MTVEAYEVNIIVIFAIFLAVSLLWYLVGGLIGKIIYKTRMTAARKKLEELFPGMPGFEKGGFSLKFSTVRPAYYI